MGRGTGGGARGAQQIVAVREVDAFGSLVRSYRRRLGLTQEDLAERAGLSERTIREMERGAKHVPRKETVQLLAGALGLDRDEREAFQLAARRMRMPGHLDLSYPLDQGLVTPPTNLPADPTPFIGREQEIGQLLALLQRPTVRLVTLTGPGGIGKTRLALQAAAQLHDSFPDGVFIVSLASLHDPDLVPATIAGALGIEERAGQPLLDTLSALLETKELLLVLDNFEHLLPAIDVISQLLAACPPLQILVTSRAVLHLAAEHEYPVPPLSVPDPAHLPNLETLAQCDGVALFIERAQAVRPTFTLTEQNAEAVAEICSRLDGLPLGIELAVARLRLLPPQALLERLSQRLPLLTGGARDRPARHQTLRAAIDWSYSLLSEGEQKLFACLSIFSGGCTLEALEAVCTSEGQLAVDVLDGVASLVDQSLLLQEGEEEPRFRMLETIHEYAAERLNASASAPALHQKHARSYLRLAETAASQLHGPQQVGWLRRLEREQDNLRAALQWSSQNQELELGMRLAIGLRQFWLARGYRSEGARWLERFPEQARSLGMVVSESTRARALSALAALTLSSDRSAVVVPWLQESIALSRKIGDTPATADALVLLAAACFDLGDMGQVAALSEESLSLGRELNDRRIIALSLFNLAGVAWARHDFTQQQELLEESVRLLREAGDLGAMVTPIEISGWGAFTRGDFERAVSRFAELRVVCQQLGNQPGIVTALFGLGTVARERGEYERAGELFAESMTVARQTDDKVARGRALLGLGDLALDLGDLDQVDIFCTEGLAIFRSTGDPMFIASALHTLGLAASQRGDFAGAAAQCREALANLEEIHFEPMIAQVMASLGLIAREQGEVSSAAAWLTESLRRTPPGRHIWWTPAALEWLAGVLSLQRQPRRAARLLGAAAARRASIGLPIWPPCRPLYNRDVSEVRAALGNEGFRAAWEDGRALTMEQAISYALGGSSVPA